MLDEPNVSLVKTDYINISTDIALVSSANIYWPCQPPTILGIWGCRVSNEYRSKPGFINKLNRNTEIIINLEG